MSRQQENSGMSEDSLRGKEVMSHCLDDADEETTNGSSSAGPASRPLGTFRSSTTGGFPPASSVSGLRRGSSGIGGGGGKGDVPSGETPGGSPNIEKKVSRVQLLRQKIESQTAERNAAAMKKRTEGGGGGPAPSGRGSGGGGGAGGGGGGGVACDPLHWFES
ncbi:kelch repeat-containing [Cystoisospora suis]|uniref:Kelch repeat-containing n=1 Tax=Cystoisospora suis TaxID=483139 RepID=A0A2C6KKB4_9APIC|nr:kelch repeat-containing [Cystoisospora suis]